jgi:hypothetical protein
MTNQGEQIFVTKISFLFKSVHSYIAFQKRPTITGFIVRIRHLWLRIRHLAKIPCFATIHFVANSLLIYSATHMLMLSFEFFYQNQCTVTYNYVFLITIMKWYRCRWRKAAKHRKTVDADI